MKPRKPMQGCSFGILGDSYSTFEGYIPQGHHCYYPRPEAVDDVLFVEDTWWYQLMQRNGMRLLVNDSYSGATVCTQVRDTLPLWTAFTERAKRSFSAGPEQPDYVFVFGGTNDSWLERTPGQTKFSHWTEADLTQVLPAYCYVLDHIARENPDAVIVSVINTDLYPDIHAGMVRAGDHYGAVTIELTQIDKQNGHPSALGMRQIAHQLQAALQ